LRGHPVNILSVKFVFEDLVPVPGDSADGEIGGDLARPRHATALAASIVYNLAVPPTMNAGQVLYADF
jgi:hypothetical protein